MIQDHTFFILNIYKTTISQVTKQAKKITFAAVTESGGMIKFPLVSRYIPELDGVRAIAVLLVISAHMHARLWSVYRGSLGVILFFVLSGYLITSIALREEADTGAVSLPAFYIRRTFRIFPLYYLVLAIHCVLIFGLGIAPEKRAPFSAAMPYYLTYFQEIFVWGKNPPDLPLGQSWTLGIEEKFYIIWPILV